MKDEVIKHLHIRDHRSIVSFRNILIHGHDTVDDRIVWDIIQDGLQNLRNDVDELIREG